jgi:hypothetical protein
MLLLLGVSVMAAGSRGAVPWCCCALPVRAAAAACISLQGIQDRGIFRAICNGTCSLLCGQFHSAAKAQLVGTLHHSTHELHTQLAGCVGAFQDYR